MRDLPANRNYAFAEAFVDELARSGVGHACLCPGSRSTPLAVALARHPRIRTWVHLDERSAGFFALGMARALRRPVALVSTSGTAAANFLPAVVEARYARVPLLVLTADRPPELWEWGAHQTVDQTRLYGGHVKWSVNLPPPEAGDGPVRYVRLLACRAVATALDPPAGPVHLNFPFREPLVPLPVPQDLAAARPREHPEAWWGREGDRPYARVHPSPRVPDPGAVAEVARGLEGVEEGLILCGPQDDPDFPAAVADLARRLGYPLLADPLSQVRCGGHDRSLVVDAYDAFLRDEEVAVALSPKVVLRFGAVPVSRPLLEFLQRHPHARHILVDEAPGWRDPLHLASEAVWAEPALFCRALASALPERRGPTPWARRWRRLNGRVREALAQQVEARDLPFEGRVFWELARLLPPGAVLFAGNSMPVRDLDAFYPSSPTPVRFLANRGASGIDGVLSSALGVSAVHPGPLVLVLGDLSFYHDMNGLLMARRYGLKATILVLNNDGGGIFSFLPQASYPEVFEEYFGTPHGLTFRAAAELYGLDYARAETWEGLRREVLRALNAPGTAVVEVPGHRARNAQLHREVWRAAAEAAREALTP